MGETFAQRLKRIVDNPVIDTVGWMTIHLQNGPVEDLRRAREGKLYYCVYLVAHSIIQTVSELMFDRKGLDGTHYFLKQFADGISTDLQFSLISEEIHEVRNLIAHRAYSKRQHEVLYFIDDIPEGWRREQDQSLTINPALYSMQVEDVFLHDKLCSEFSKQPPLQLLRLKYKFVRQWLELDKSNAISQMIKGLDSLDAYADLQAEDAQIRGALYSRYEL